MLRRERRDVDGGAVADILVLSRPGTRNALSAPLLADLAAALDHAATDTSVRAVILTGDGDAFASGGDLRELRHARSAAAAEALLLAGRAVTDRIATLPVPVIAVLPGPAVGGGAELAVACDLRIAEPDARLCFKHVRMGASTAWGTTSRLPSLVGAGAAARLVFLAQDVGAAEAHALGLVDAVVNRGEGLTAALTWVAEIGWGSPSALAAMKGLLRGDGSRDAEARAFVETWSGPDHAEAMDAHFAKRPPAFAPRRPGLPRGGSVSGS